MLYQGETFQILECDTQRMITQTFFASNSECRRKSHSGPPTIPHTWQIGDCFTDGHERMEAYDCNDVEVKFRPCRTSAIPTTHPSQNPLSSSPSTSLPSTTPTINPSTNCPTLTPTSSYPTQHPAVKSTFSPTFQPSVFPSIRPSIQPTVNKTVIHTPKAVGKTRHHHYFLFICIILIISFICIYFLYDQSSFTFEKSEPMLLEDFENIRPTVASFKRIGPREDTIVQPGPKPSFKRGPDKSRAEIFEQDTGIKPGAEVHSENPRILTISQIMQKKDTFANRPINPSNLSPSKSNHRSDSDSKRQSPTSNYRRNSDGSLQFIGSTSLISSRRNVSKHAKNSTMMSHSLKEFLKAQGLEKFILDLQRYHIKHIEDMVMMNSSDIDDFYRVPTIMQRHKLEQIFSSASS